jgi:hypothetical protein
MFKLIKLFFDYIFKITIDFRIKNKLIELSQIEDEIVILHAERRHIYMKWQELCLNKRKLEVSK